LELFGVHRMMATHASICRPLLQHGNEELTVEKLEELFNVQYTVDRCNRQDLEQAVMINWKFFLLAVRSKILLFYLWLYVFKLFPLLPDAFCM
jgi:hypothetical protein